MKALLLQPGVAFVQISVQIVYECGKHLVKKLFLVVKRKLYLFVNGHLMITTQRHFAVVWQNFIESFKVFVFDAGFQRESAEDQAFASNAKPMLQSEACKPLSNFGSRHYKCAVSYKSVQSRIACYFAQGLLAKRTLALQQIQLPRSPFFSNLHRRPRRWRIRSAPMAANPADQIPQVGKKPARLFMAIQTRCA